MGQVRTSGSLDSRSVASLLHARSGWQFFWMALCRPQGLLHRRAALGM